MATKQFKAESKRLLDLMINSIYTNREIFLRELISNASDAIDKSYYRSLVDENVNFNKDDFYIRISLDKDKRTFTITDTGIGMTKEELENNLGTIAKSGSLAFKNENEIKDGVDIIGQFGVGFYSAFMVSDQVTVKSRALDSDTAYKWESSGVEGYEIEPCEKETVGTEIILKIKENTEDEKYDEFLDQYKIQSLIKKYSDFIKYPIKMMVKKSRPKKDNDKEYEDYFEDETLNSMVPIWRKNKNELKPEDYEQFYKDKHFGYEKPLKVIHSKAEGLVSYTTLLFIPAKAPYDFYTKEFEKGLELYSNGVLIMEKCADLLPDYFSFVQGLVDSADLSLNISRELLQHDRQLKFIAKKIKDKIKGELLLMMKNDRDKYIEFYNSFGKQLKYGVYSEFGANKDVLQDLLMFYSSTEKKLVSLDEYVSRMKEDQKYIYYAAGENIEKIEKLPQTELVKDKNFEILYFTDDVDEFAIKMLMKYKDKEFKSVSSKDLGFDSDDKESKKETEENKELFDFMKDVLKDKVKEVRASNRLKTHPVCLANEGDLSIEMEKVLNMMPNNQNIKADKILEINTNHEMFKAIKKAFEEDKEKLKMYSNLLYNQALLIEGLPVEDPVQFANDVCCLIK
ncbi:MAG: molecular chaperone HtpG [Clostridium sp.]|jgi:molecular chaperone HtpG|uniref:molecular chaperone HtpG n=1 Tax=Clostridium sp. TaxID=1506 RepID=UPI0025C1674C|nr:molecular chaperone HtpG [Clostridium sp.]MCH3963634.1 molecular chaperone HtpG [Clostridium sp.]MCI1714775.1 molecular chaperone HtpG [Clostridium sp.]MCI1799036.1 molecular chaperone HtpG [Clostridium sp.]MCI1812958.1 molecular chaperone HtpG [Clostridium sp.]MCI1869848.1 molecular chaperone HtpG [Clostridium sp.]